MHNRYDRIEYKEGDRYYKVIIKGMVVALCPYEEMAKMCYFALTCYKRDLLYYANQLRDLGE